MALFTDEAAKMQDLEARIAALETHTCPQQGVLDDLIACVTALEARPAGTVDLTAVNAALAELDARLDKIATGAVG
jgi:uncharacterized coiled-coil protein SlyX